MRPTVLLDEARPLRALRLALTAAAVIVLAAAAPARAEPPRVNGDLVYERRGDLFVVGTEALVDTPKATRLTRDRRANRDPAWSARATRLAFASRRGGNSDIWVMKVPREGAPERLTDDPASDTSPSWAPDGGSIAFTSRRGGTSDVWVMNADGTAPRAVASGPAVERQPAWSPDGDWIAFASNRSGTYAIWVMRSDGTDARQLAASGGYAGDPTWSPDSRRIAFAAGSGRSATGIVTLDAATGADLRTVTSPGSADRAPAWSPDGLQILYTHDGGLRFSDAPGTSAALATIATLAGQRSRVSAGVNADWGPLPMPASPEAGESVIARPTDEIEVQVPGSKQLVPLDEDAELPVDTLVDTGDAALDIVATGGPDGENTSARLSGRFTYTQSADGQTNELLFGRPDDCQPGVRASASVLRYDNGYIVVNKPGRWRGKGRHTNGAARRTAWYMKVTCDKEITVVTEGVVDVEDPDRPSPIPVVAGQCYVYPSLTGRPLAGNCDIRVRPPQ